MSRSTPHPFHLPDEAATVAFARKLADLLRPGDVIALFGDLGAGKTSLVRAAIRALVDDDEAEVPSPTFTLVQLYDAEAAPVRHFDLYRLTTPDEAVELGWDEDLGVAITFVEWPDRLGPFLPRERLDVTLSLAAGGGRTLSLKGSAGWAGRVALLEHA